MKINMRRYGPCILSGFRMAHVTTVRWYNPVAFGNIFLWGLARTSRFQVFLIHSCSEAMEYFVISLVASSYDMYRALYLPLCAPFVSDTHAVLSTSSKVLSSLYSTVQFISSALNSLNALPWGGLVNISAHILSAGKCSISRSPCATLFVTNKYLFFVCLVQLELDNLPFFSKSMARYPAPIGLNTQKIGTYL